MSYFLVKKKRGGQEKNVIRFTSLILRLTLSTCQRFFTKSVGLFQLAFR